MRSPFRSRARALAAAAALTVATGTAFAALPSHASAGDGPLTPAQAWEVRVTGTFNPIVDDDSTIFGSSFSTASSTFSKTFSVSTGAPGAFDFVWSGCAGNEVNGKLFFDMALRNSAITFQGTLDLHEGTRCLDSDIDGRVRTEVFTVGAGQSRNVHMRSVMQFESGLDSVTVDYTVNRRRSRSSERRPFPDVEDGRRLRTAGR